MLPTGHINNVDVPKYCVPCPFCKGTQIGFQGTLHGGVWSVMCYICDASGPVKKTQRMAMKAWGLKTMAGVKRLIKKG